MPRTVEEILAAQQAELEASQQRIKDLESQLSLSQGTISSQGEQLHIDAVNKRVAALQGAGYPPALCLAVKTVMEADKGRITGAPEDGLNLSISRPTKAEDGTEGVEELKLSTATDVVEFLLSAVPTGDGTEAAKLAGLHAGLGELNASAHEDRNSDKAKIDAVEAHEREAHPERFKDNGKGERL